MIMRYSKTLRAFCSLPVLTALLFLPACSSQTSLSSQTSQSDQHIEGKGYAFTGETEFGAVPDSTDPNLQSLVQITDPGLKAVLNYDQSKTMEIQQAELQIIDSKNQVIDSKTINVWIRPDQSPEIELISPTEPVSAAGFSIQNYVQATMLKGKQPVSLDWISSQDLVEGKPGYVLYDMKTGEPFNPGTPWVDGDYQFSIIASDGLGLSVLAGPLVFTLAG